MINYFVIMFSIAGMLLLANIDQIIGIEEMGRSSMSLVALIVIGVNILFALFLNTVSEVIKKLEKISSKIIATILTAVVMITLIILGTPRVIEVFVKIAATFS